MARSPDPTAIARCPLCSHGTWRMLGRWQEYRLLRCRHCRLVYAWPRPSPEQLAATYESTYYARAPGQRTGYDDYFGMAEDNMRAMWSAVQRQLTALSPRAPGRLLDVGCGSGTFAGAARLSGWEADGVELSAYVAAIGSARYGVNIHVGTLHDEVFRANSFDAITMWHVLEHVQRPLADLRRAAELLRPGGVLLIEMPNWNSIGRRARGLAWAQIKPPEHINYFTPRTLAATVRQAALRVRSVRTLYAPAVAAARFRVTGRAAMGGIRVATRLIGWIGWGGYIRLWASKPP